MPRQPIAPREPDLPFRRRYYQLEELDARRGAYDDRLRGRNDRLVEVREPQANLVSSATTTPDLHAPVLDFDFPCRLIESSTPGKFHLYIDKQIHWDAYERILFQLFDAGLIEEGWYRGAIRNRMTTVRKGGTLKTNSPFRGVLEENEELERQKAALEEQKLELERQIKLLETQLEEAGSGVALTWN